ncbi:hypothetical protein [Actinomadura rubrobrunea]|nr:hypothetical protein [Actinomadura rubrobrunea]
MTPKDHRSGAASRFRPPNAPPDARPFPQAITRPEGRRPAGGAAGEAV